MPPSPKSQAPQPLPESPNPPPPPPPTVVYSWKEYNPHIKLHYIRDHDEANLLLAQHASSTRSFGFDLEWRPNFIKGQLENPVALVQLANDTAIFLLQISRMKEFPLVLTEILRNPSIIKAGVAIQNDAKKLCVEQELDMNNCVDLSLLARTVDNAHWKGKYTLPLGLARLVEKYENRLLPKGKITRSNWEAILDDHQQEYAACDAHAGYTLHEKLVSMIPDLDETPNRDWYSFNYNHAEARYTTCTDQWLWHARNPKYDPGPPPPPKFPKGRPQITKGEHADNISTSTQERAQVGLNGSSSSSSAHGNNRNTRRNQSGNGGNFPARQQQQQVHDDDNRRNESHQRRGRFNETHHHHHRHNGQGRYNNPPRRHRQPSQLISSTRGGVTGLRTGGIGPFPVHSNSNYRNGNEAENEERPS